MVDNHFLLKKKYTNLLKSKEGVSGRDTPSAGVFIDSFLFPISILLIDQSCYREQSKELQLLSGSAELRLHLVRLVRL